VRRSYCVADGGEVNSRVVVVVFCLFWLSHSRYDTVDVVEDGGIVWL